MKITELKEKDSSALKKFKNKVLREFPDARFTLFGSKIRSQDDDFSDIDVLIILKKKVTTDLEKRIFGVGFEVGLEFGVVFGIVVEENKFWNSALAKAMPFYQNVAKEGLIL